jgi:hypothetical protein
MYSAFSNWLIILSESVAVNLIFAKDTGLALIGIAAVAVCLRFTIVGAYPLRTQSASTDR